MVPLEKDKIVESGTASLGYAQPDRDSVEPIAAIRDLLTAAFGAEELRRFCQDRAAFRPVVDRFGPGHGLDDMVDEVIVYCGQRLLWDELLAEVGRVNARQYARFEERLRG